MNMRCICGHNLFLLDYDAVRKIDSRVNVLSTVIADPCGEGVTCEKCFQTSITDLESGKKVNQAPELMRKVFVLAESSQSLTPIITDKPAGFETADVMFGFITSDDWHSTPKDREDAIGILADFASSRTHEAVQAVLNRQSPFIGQARAGVKIRVTLSVHPEADATYFAKPECKTTCYTVVLDDPLPENS